MRSIRRSLSVRHLPLLLAGLLLATPQAPAPATSESFACDDARGILENEASNHFTCWGHWGTHTYVVRDTHGVFLASGYGAVRSVENWNAPTEIGLAIETSLDGRHWSPVQSVLLTPDTCNLAGLRCPRTFSFTLGPSANEFRFLRLRQPTSALQGLTGFLDGSWMVLNLTVGEPIATGATTTSRALSCARDTMEGIFAAHPCTYGGFYYDSASAYHTYPLDGVAQITRVDVNATFLPFRQGTGSGSPRGLPLGTMAVLEARVGAAGTWTTLATWGAQYGVSSDISWSDPAGRPAEYLRLRTEAYCVGSSTCCDCQHYWRGYLLASDLTIAGRPPT